MNRTHNSKSQSITSTNRAYTTHRSIKGIPGMTYLVLDGTDGATEEALNQRGRQYEVPPSAPHVKLYNHKNQTKAPLVVKSVPIKSKSGWAIG